MNRRADPSAPDGAARWPGPGACFAGYAKALNNSVVAGPEGGPYPCPCCGDVTLTERGGYEICDVCGWVDDGQDEVIGGRLTEARRRIAVQRQRSQRRLKQSQRRHQDPS